MTRIFLLAILLLGSVGCSMRSLPLIPQQPLAFQEIEPFSKKDTVLVLAPHPDDEAIACAGIIQKALSAGAKVYIAYLTNGDHNQVAFIVYEKRLTIKKGEFLHMGKVRKLEAVKAMKLLGIPEENLIFLGYPDIGTFAIFRQYWQTDRPYRSLLTRVTKVPYKDDLSFAAPYVGESILSDLKTVLLRYKPNKIFVSHPADTNGDHKAGYLFLQIALRDLRADIPAPAVYPYLVHCVGWPLPRHYHPELNLAPPKKFAKSGMSWLQVPLSQAELEKKHQAILCYKSQTESSAFYLLSFARRNELLSDLPEIPLKRQVSVSGREPEFSGFSALFRDTLETVYEEGRTTEEDISDSEGRAGFAIVDNNLVVRIEKNKEVRSRLRFILYLFGYNNRLAFPKMPKLRIIVKNGKFKIFDGPKIIHPEGVVLEASPDRVTIRIPLSVLGGPDFVLASVRAYGGMVPVDATAFRRLTIQ